MGKYDNIVLFQNSSSFHLHVVLISVLSRLTNHQHAASHTLLSIAMSPQVSTISGEQLSSRTFYSFTSMRPSARAEALTMTPDGSLLIIGTRAGEVGLSFNLAHWVALAILDDSAPGASPSPLTQQSRWMLELYP